MPKTCPECGFREIRAYGLGTEKVETELLQSFPQARTLRWDWETTRKKESHELILHHFAAGRADVLIGTQMLAKGLDFPRVTLVGIVMADVGLFLPDPFAAERVFQLLTQVAGRAGRSTRGRPGGSADLRAGSLCHPGRQQARCERLPRVGTGSAQAPRFSAVHPLAAPGVPALRSAQGGGAGAFPWRNTGVDDWPAAQSPRRRSSDRRPASSPGWRAAIAGRSCCAARTRANTLRACAWTAGASRSIRSLCYNADAGRQASAACGGCISIHAGSG